MRIKDWSMSKKLSFGFGIILLLIIVITLVSYNNLAVILSDISASNFE